MSDTRTDHAAAIRRHVDWIRRDLEPDYDEDADAIVAHADALDAENAMLRAERDAALGLLRQHGVTGVLIGSYPYPEPASPDDDFEVRHFSAKITDGRPDD